MSIYAECFRAFWFGALSACLATYIGKGYFPAFSLMAAVGLTALSLSIVSDKWLEQNRVSIWQDGESGWSANALLTARFTASFLGIFITALALEGALGIHLFGGEGVFKKGVSGNFSGIFVNNIKVLLTAFCFGVLYRAGGLVLILAWNGFHWAHSLYLLKTGGALKTFFALALFIPHMAVEVFGYALSGLAGVFLSKAVFKYNFSSDKFQRVSRACLVLIALGVFSIALGAFLEVYVINALT